MRRRTGPSAATVRLVRARDLWACIRCGTSAGPLTTHHRKPRGMGGTKDPTINSPANLVTLCGSGTTGCHGWVETHRDAAYSLGLLVRHSHNPTVVPVCVYQWGYALLADDGSINYLDWSEPA